MCRIEAMEECIARKSHELPARQPSATLTTGASPFPLSPAQLVAGGDAPLPESNDNGVSEVRYIAELQLRGLFLELLSYPAKEPKRPQTRLGLQSRKDSWVLTDPNVFSDSDLEVGAVPGRRAEGSSTTSAWSDQPEPAGKCTISALSRQRAEGAALRLRRRRRPGQSVPGVTLTRPTGGMFGIISSISSLV